VASADASSVAGTPSFFINGKRHHGAYDLGTLTVTVRAARTRRDQAPCCEPSEQLKGGARLGDQHRPPDP
jgi:hypothetical protein